MREVILRLFFFRKIGLRLGAVKHAVPVRVFLRFDDSVKQSH